MIKSSEEAYLGVIISDSSPFTYLLPRDTAKCFIFFFLLSFFCRLRKLSSSLSCLLPPLLKHVGDILSVRLGHAQAGGMSMRHVSKRQHLYIQLYIPGPHRNNHILTVDPEPVQKKTIALIKLQFHNPP